MMATGDRLLCQNDHAGLVNEYDSDGWLPIHYLANPLPHEMSTQIHILDILINTGARVADNNANGLNLLHLCMIRQPPASMIWSSIVDRCSLKDINACCEFGNTALHYAAEYGKQIDLFNNSIQS